MKRRSVSVTALTLLFIIILTSAFGIHLVQANSALQVKSYAGVNQLTANAGGEGATSGTEVGIAYDDGTCENAYSWPVVGYKMAVRFTPSFSGQLKRCSFYIYSDPTSVKVHVMDSDKIDVITPFTCSVTTTGWISVDLSAYEFNVNSGVDFYIGLEWTLAGAPYLAVDTSSPDGRSWDWAGGWSLWSSEDYMIRAVVEGEVYADMNVDPMHLDFYEQASTATPSLAAGESRSAIDDKRTDYPLMQLDSEMLQEWVKAYNSAPHAYIDSESAPPTGYFSLLDHLEYIPSERDQGDCGNCWVWGGTGVMEVALDVQEDIKDRLSVQYFTSCWHGGVPYDWACCGGNLGEFAGWYQGNGFVIPWSNTNANWQDGDRECKDGTSVPGDTIATSPNYTLSSCTAETVVTHGVGQAQAIANIKNVLYQGKAIYFGFQLPNSADWSTFIDDFWKTQPESAVWSPDYSNGHTYEPPPLGGGAGHAVLCVGYNDTDPDNSYWIMVNSWGTTAGRPNGIFHLNMTMNYDCQLPGLPGLDYSLQFQTLDVDFEVEGGPQPVTISNAGIADLEVTSIECDQPWLSVSQTCPPSFVLLSEESRTVWIHVDPTGLDGGVYYGNVQIYSNDPDENPVTVTVTLYVEPRAYLVVRGSNNGIYCRIYDCLEDSWSAWTELPGSTPNSPAAAVSGSEFHMVVRGVNNGEIWHCYTPVGETSFSDWELLSGATPSPPTLTGNGTHLCLVVRGNNNMIYCRLYELATRVWGDWVEVPGGATPDTPAARLVGNELHLVVKGTNYNQIWYRTADLDSGSFSDWTLLTGATPSPPTLTGNSTHLCLVVRGNTNVIYYRFYDLEAESWGDWVDLPYGTTPDVPAATIVGDDLHIVVRGMSYDQIWHGCRNLVSDEWSDWNLLDGATPSKPVLTS